MIHPSARCKRRLKLVLAVVGAFALLVATGFWWSPELLLVESAPISADVIVVLGGGLEHRARLAAKLYRDGLAPAVLVSGHGDCDDNLRYLGQGEVPPSVIQVECESRSTWENAARSVPLLRQRGVRRVLLVTSWYHTRRALAVFRQAAPEITFVCVPTRHLLGDDGRPTREAFRFVLKEYFKLAWYALRHRAAKPAPQPPTLPVTFPSTR